MSIYENILLSTIKSLCIFNSKLFYFRHTEHTFHINLIQAGLEANDLIDHAQLLVQWF